MVNWSNVVNYFMFVCLQYMQKEVMVKIEKDTEPIFTTAFQLKYNARKMKK